jgi:ABC-type uncharacterized transport system involved in gliding motility auxiliary subunit
MSKYGKISFFICGLTFFILLVLRFIVGGWIPYFWPPLILTVVSFIAAFAFDWRFYYDFFTMKTTKHGMNMGGLILSALALAIAANYLAVRFDKSFDLTEEKLNSLSEQSQQVVEKLPGEVMFTVLYKGADDLGPRELAKQNLNFFADQSPKIKIRYINIYENVAAAKSYFTNSDQAGFKVIAEYKDNKTFVDDDLQEASITAALVKVTRGEPKTIYFITGHGESDIDESGDTGLSMLRLGLQEMSFKAAKIRLATGDRLPENAADSAVAIVGPRSPFLDSEIEQIRNYVMRGGRLLIAIDPGQRHDLANLTKSLGIEFKNNYVTTEKIQKVGLATFGAEYDRASPITRKFALGFLTLFLEASAVSRAPDVNTAWTTRDLVKSESQASIVNDPTKGPVPGSEKTHTLAIEIEIPVAESEKKSVSDTFSKGQVADKVDVRDEKRAQVIVVGDSDFLSDRAIFQMGNRDLALNIFASLGREADLTGIRPKQPKGASLILTRNGRYMIVAAGVGLPVVLLLLSGVFWYRRRNL